jgi:hypothetical protein
MIPKELYENNPDWFRSIPIAKTFSYETNEKRADVIYDEDEYVKRHGSRCPVCASRDIEATGQGDTDGNWHTERIVCNFCKSVWNDFYCLTGYELLEVNPGEEDEEAQNS